MANPEHYQISRTWGHVLTTKFGNIIIGEKIRLKQSRKRRSSLKTGQESANVQIGYDKIG
jgi:hypothetical protein